MVSELLGEKSARIKISFEVRNKRYMAEIKSKDHGICDVVGEHFQRNEMLWKIYFQRKPCGYWYKIVPR